MPKLSLYRAEKSHDYKFFDKTISEMFTIGATDLYVHKYAGIQDQGPSKDKSQPQYDKLDPTNIQDLLFLENRDRNYESDIYRIRGHYNVQNLDFDLSQFGLFLTNDIIFVTVHYNDMITGIGRKLIVGDVLELPHLADYHPLNEKIPAALRRYYQVTDGNYASEGFSQTWYPHLWRIKCEPLVDSQEFSNILEQPTNKENYLGDWDKNKTYVPGYVVSYGDKNYTPLVDVPANIPCSAEAWKPTKKYPADHFVTLDGITYKTLQAVPKNTPCTNTDYYIAYWQIDAADSLKDILSRYNTNIAINEANIQEATRIVPKSGYDRSQLYVVPTYEDNQPASPVSFSNFKGSSILGRVEKINSNDYAPSPVIRIDLNTYKHLTDYPEVVAAIGNFSTIELSLVEIKPEMIGTGSGMVGNELVLRINPISSSTTAGLEISSPYGTADNIYSSSDQNVSADGFGNTITENIMNYRADIDPRFRYTARTTPRSFGYTNGYMVGSDKAPNSEPLRTGIAFPTDAKVGDYFLRLDYLPQQMFRWDGKRWVKISENVRTGAGLTSDDQSLKSTFINNERDIKLSNGQTMPERQSLSSVLRIETD